MKSIVYRALDAADSLDSLTALLHRAYAPLAAAGMNYTASYQTAEVTRKRAAQGECFVAVVDGTVCGTIVFRSAAQTSGCPWYDRPDVASCGQFAVEPALRGHGIGARLMEIATARAVTTGAREFALDTAETAAHLVDWYMRLGFRFVEHARWPGKTYRSLILSRPIG